MTKELSLKRMLSSITQMVINLKVFMEERETLRMWRTMRKEEGREMEGRVRKGRRIMEL
jgi:hypothetical protein